MKVKRFCFLIRTADVDAIGVKRQKEKRVKDYKKALKTVQTDIIELQKPNGAFEYITPGCGVKYWDIETALLCWICFHYGQQKLPIVAITDGARTIRNRRRRVFGGQVIIILDYYDLKKKSILRLNDTFRFTK